MIIGDRHFEDMGRSIALLFRMVSVRIHKFLGRARVLSIKTVGSWVALRMEEDARPSRCLDIRGRMVLKCKSVTEY